MSSSHLQDRASLENAVFEQIEPLVRKIVRWRLGATAASQDQEDVAGDVVLELLVRLNAPDRGEVADLSAYAAVAAHHGCDRYLRRRFPQRHRLSSRLRYLLETSREYAAWEIEGTLVCGEAKRRGSAAKAGLDPAWTKQVALPAGADEAAAVGSILGHIGGAIRFADLVEAVAALLGIRDQAIPAESGMLAARAEDADARMDRQKVLQRLWGEIGLLPRPQRVALLLNLRDDDGACALTSLPFTGVASMREIARVIEIPAEELAGIWRKLPLSDLEIAERLGLSRQQIINLRKSARQRLARRMTGNMAAETASKEVDSGRV